MHAFPFLADVLDLASRQSVVMVAIVGPPGSGKTSTATAVKQVLDSQLRTAVVSMDGYHLRNCDLRARGLLPWKGCHFTFDANQFMDDMLMIRQGGRTLSLPGYDRTQYHDPVPDQIQVSANDQCILVEGNYLLLDFEPWNRLSRCWDYSVYIEVDDEIQMGRLLHRHARQEDPAYAFGKVHSTDLPNTQLIRASKSRASTIFKPIGNFS